jgi:ferric-dicitrate binding protein FerR (iron transport regulator)
MNATLGNPTANVRASDADRDAVLSELSEHFQAGRLTAAEFDERAGQALAARTWGELRDLMRDLPTALSGPQTRTATSSAPAPVRPSGRPAVLPVAALAGIGIAVAVLVGVAHTGWGFLLLVVFVLCIARRVTCRAGA